MKSRILLRAFLAIVLLQMTTVEGWGRESTRRITLDEAVQLFLENNVELHDRELEIDIALAKKKTAGLWANPSLSFAREDLSFGDLEYSEDVIGLELEFDIFFKRSLRKKAAGYGVDAAMSQFAHYRAGAIGELKRAYILTVLAKKRVSLLEETAEVFDVAASTGRARLDEGDISEFDQMRLAAEGERYRRELAYARIEYEAMQRQLGVMVSPELHGLKEPAPGGARSADPGAIGGGSPQSMASRYEPADDLEFTPFAITLEESLQRALRERKDLRQMEFAVRASHESVRLAKRGRLPVLSLFGGYKSQSDDFAGSAVGVTMALPVFDRNQGEIASGQAQLRQFEARRASLERQVRAQVESANMKVQTLGAEAQSVARQKRASDGEILEIARAAYAEGEMSLLGLLDAAEANYEKQLANYRLLAEYMLGLVELEIAMGGGPLR